jgi:hypothetical protein
MYKPCKPIITKISQGYKKYLRFGPSLISAREMGVELLDGRLVAKILKQGKAYLQWIPKGGKK